MPTSTDELPRTGSWYTIKVTGTGGLKFENTSSVNLQRKSMSIMIQTDKGAYKPGQEGMEPFTAWL